MKVEILGAYGGESPRCRMTCLLINDTIALDAGSLSRAMPIERQANVRSIVLSHSHIDHTNTLPFFIENVYGKRQGAIDIYASHETIFAIRKYLFNNATWPDFTRLPNHLLPAVQFREIEAEEPLELDGVTFTPFEVSHSVPTFGFVIEDGGKALIWSSDTGPTERLWELANKKNNLGAVCIDTSFDNALQEVADVSYHLTPQTLNDELQKLNRDVPVLLHHLKPPCVDKVHQEVRAMNLPNVEFLEQGRVYEF